MTVEVISMQGGGGVQDPNLFTDFFAPIRPDQPFVIGNQWNFDMEPNDAQGWTGTQLASFFNVVATGLQYGNTTAGGTIPRGFAVPRNLSWARVQARNQFAEYRIVADNSIAALQTRQGPMVLCNPNLGECYFVELAQDAGAGFQLAIGRWSLNAFAAVIGPIVSPAYALGDTITLTAEILPAQVDLEVFVNGVSTIVGSDAAAGRLTTGMPGIHCEGFSTLRFVTIDQFRCGELNRL
ncbi:hypothetical protein L0244_38705 [bacterium]|nr:hypothetical protein [bacterium]